MVGSRSYSLDCRLTVKDIEALIERSFLIRETNYRRLHRLLQWKINTSPSRERPSYEPSVIFEATDSASPAEEFLSFGDKAPISSPVEGERSQGRSSYQSSIVRLDVRQLENVQSLISFEGPSELESRSTLSGQLRLRAARIKEEGD
ncbi:hypothetical protein CC78DRAFT_610989 [Lojkania enalia]|uniref:Uncharacterized protein n=1 Tax=Lojkania enalia TaxID=147567 RepID=A0A9P4ND58_9PLEO|nr:hypothetical protein CC78DRAFT_610989 [Didymosphaeria enalia]